MHISKLFLLLAAGIVVSSSEETQKGLLGIPSTGPQVFFEFVLKGNINVPNVLSLKTIGPLDSVLPGVIAVRQQLNNDPSSYTESLSFSTPSFSTHHHISTYVHSKLIDSIEVYNGELVDFIPLVIGGNLYFVLTTKAVGSQGVWTSLETAADASTDPLNLSKRYILLLAEGTDGIYHFTIAKSQTGGQFGFCACIFDSLRVPAAAKQSPVGIGSNCFFNVRATFAARGLPAAPPNSLEYICPDAPGSAVKEVTADVLQTVALNNPSLLNSAVSAETFSFAVDKGNCCDDTDGVDVFAESLSGVYHKIQCLPASNVVSTSTITIDGTVYIAIAKAATRGHGLGLLGLSNEKFLHAQPEPASIDIYGYSNVTNEFELICNIKAAHVKQVRFDILGETGPVIYVLKGTTIDKAADVTKGSSGPENSYFETFSFLTTAVRGIHPPGPTCVASLGTVPAPPESTLLRPVTFTANGRIIYHILVTNAQGTSIYKAKYESSNKKSDD